ncbi:hypothetical protein PVAND_000980 [Polypedilum vanderplanki]|uniref:Sperm-associated antigen 1 n=1 Tax=Polypedilum vanderplanki TaxID=319348 RepID=A0A9J6BLU2_POLVA|nr:hypothetical protein PVAND_000980 [Polypedilum vanderplanki]
MSEKPPKKTLLQKYEIPVEFLDFDYLKTCTEAKTVEKIVKILRSGEEGYYPDLQKFAEDKLKELKPNSKVFRVEEPAVKIHTLDDEKRNEIESDMKSWLNEMKKQDQILKEIKPKENKTEPPIRKSTNGVEKTVPKSQERIKSTDYSKWDKFDADAAVLKIDLDEERQREAVELKNKRNLEKSNLIEVIEDKEVDELSEFERERMSLKFKEKGNEAFKAKDYDEAIREYSESIRFKKNAAAFNNRALVYLKKKEYIRVISDTNECLQIEPQNTKAINRKGLAFLGNEMWTEAYNAFEKVLQIQPENQVAQQELLKLQPKMPSRTAVRMKIEVIEEIKPEEQKKKIIKKTSEKLEINESSHIPKLVQNIVPIEATPFDKLMPPKGDEKPREKLLIPNDAQQNKNNRILIQEIN